MPDGSEPAAIRVLTGIDEIPAVAWDACAGPDHPFVSHAFLKALEDSGSVGQEAGWLPQHLAYHDDEGRLLGCVPLYLKSHSYGEYVFDWAWADAYERAGGRYYPKLQSSVPFTPVTGPRLLVHPEADWRQTAGVLAGAIVELARQLEISSAHVTFPTQREWSLLGDLGMLQRRGLQYRWDNRGYEDFDGFLGALASRKRKAIRKERREAEASGLAITRRSGGDIAPRHWDAFYRFYIATSDRKWGHPYLTREFFRQIGAALGEKVVLVLAEDEGRPVAGALNLRGGDTLYGRNWGCLGHFKFLHFELCYYQAIDYAIQEGLQHVEAGAQGEHKIQRGYLPVETYSAHWIADGGFRQAVEDFLLREGRAISHEARALAGEGPYRKDGCG